MILLDNQDFLSLIPVQGGYISLKLLSDSTKSLNISKCLLSTQPFKCQFFSTFSQSTYSHNSTEKNSENMEQDLIPSEFQLPAEILSYQV